MHLNATIYGKPLAGSYHNYTIDHWRNFANTFNTCTDALFVCSQPPTNG